MHSNKKGITPGKKKVGVIAYLAFDVQAVSEDEAILNVNQSVDFMLEHLGCVDRFIHHPGCCDTPSEDGDVWLAASEIVVSS